MEKETDRYTNEQIDVAVSKAAYEFLRRPVKGFCEPVSQYIGTMSGSDALHMIEVMREKGLIRE